MEKITSTDAKREFGEVLLKSQSGPISVTKNGKPVAVVMSDTEYKSLKLMALRAALVEGEESGEAGTLDISEIKQLARERINKSNKEITKT